MPLRGDWILFARAAEPDETAVGAERRARLAYGDPQQPVDVQLGADLGRDSGDETLALERFAERQRRTPAISRLAEAFRLPPGTQP